MTPYDPPKYLGDGCGCCSNHERLFTVVRKAEMPDGSFVLVVIDSEYARTYANSVHNVEALTPARKQALVEVIR